MNLILGLVAWILHAVFGQTIEPEQLSFFVGMYISMGGAYFFKNKLQCSKVSVEIQLYLLGCAGVWLYYFIWGWLVVLPVVEVVMCYTMMRMMPVQTSTRFIFVFAMSFLAMCHISMVYIEFNSATEENSADFTGPIMIVTQRITSLAFSLKDGLGTEELNENRSKHAIRKMPTFPEYFAYMFSLFGIMCGPFAFYNDIMPYLAKKSGNKVVMSKAVSAMMCISIYWLGSKLMPGRRNIADATHNAAGIGYNGPNTDGSPRWDLVSNVNVVNIEFATGLKFYIDNWNIMCVQWIRHVSYDRLAPKHRTLASFLLSAVWHGFFPGYYIMFLTLHLFTIAQRKVRRAIRPFFQTTTTNRYFYEISTFMVTQLAVSYASISFMVLEWNGSMRLYKSVWFVGHVIPILLYFLVPSRSSEKKSTPSKQSSYVADSTDIKGGHEGIIEFYKKSLQGNQSTVRHR